MNHNDFCSGIEAAGETLVTLTRSERDVQAVFL